jgi:hypothetical protein
MAATRPDGPAARALGEIDAAPAARVMGLAVRVLLELSSARGTADMAAPDVTPLVSGAGALLPLPRPDYLRRLVGGTPCDQPAGQIKLREWLPMAVVPPALANAARRFLRAHLMCDELAAFRANWRYGADGTANNAGCGSGLEWVQCRYCGLADVESGRKHLRTEAQKKLHAAWKCGYEERGAAELEAAELKRQRIAAERIAAAAAPALWLGAADPHGDGTPGPPPIPDLTSFPLGDDGGVQVQMTATHNGCDSTINEHQHPFLTFLQTYIKSGNYFQ